MSALSRFWQQMNLSECITLKTKKKFVFCVTETRVLTISKIIIFVQYGIHVKRLRSFSVLMGNYDSLKDIHLVHSSTISQATEGRLWDIVGECTNWMSFNESQSPFSTQNLSIHMHSILYKGDTLGSVSERLLDWPKLDWYP